MSSQQSQRLLTIAEAADYLGMTARALSQLRYRESADGRPGGPPAIKYGSGRNSKLWFRLDDLERYLDERSERRVGPQAEGKRSAPRGSKRRDTVVVGLRMANGGPP